MGGKSDDSPRESSANSYADNEVQESEPRAETSILRNSLAANELHEFEERKGDGKSDAKRGDSIMRSKFVRFSKFNFVGGIGIVVQFAALFLLKSVLHLNYLVATALAVEIAVLHNFVWHERFTWVDRIKPDRIKPDRTKSDRIAQATHASARASLARLARFHLGNGAVSIVGNVALMKVMVGVGHVNYLVANAIAIVTCSLANFLVSDGWVFEE